MGPDFDGPDYDGPDFDMEPNSNAFFAIWNIVLIMTLMNCSLQKKMMNEESAAILGWVNANELMINLYWEVLHW
jgi:hypothetical protein